MKTSERWVLWAPSLTWRRCVQGGGRLVKAAHPGRVSGPCAGWTVPWLHPAQPKARSLPCRGAVLGGRGHSLSPAWVPLEKLIGPPLRTRDLVVDGTARVDPVERTLFFGCSPQVWVDVGPLLGHHRHRTARKQARVADTQAEPACVGLTLGGRELSLLGVSCRSASRWLTSEGEAPRLSSNRS